MKLKTVCTLEHGIGGNLHPCSPVVVTDIWLQNKPFLVLFTVRTVLCVDKKNLKLLLLEPHTENVWQHLTELKVHTCFDSEAHL